MGFPDAKVAMSYSKRFTHSTYQDDSTMRRMAGCCSDGATNRAVRFGHSSAAR